MAGKHAGELPKRLIELLKEAATLSCLAILALAIILLFRSDVLGDKASQAPSAEQASDRKNEVRPTLEEMIPTFHNLGRSSH